MPSDWRDVTSPPPLHAKEVQLWKIDLAGAGGDLERYPERYRKHLSASELGRADRLRAGQVRMQFVVARACLRTLLGTLRCLPPGEVPITLSAYGKPESPTLDGLPLFFNLAHSRDTVLIALCRSGSVGVDIEYLDRSVDALELARNSFTAKEFSEIERTTDQAARQRAFFRAWTRKEAVAKADGRGLSLPFTSFEVPVLGPASSTSVAVAGSPESPQTSSAWFVTDIDPGNEAAGAYAVGLPLLRAQTFRFPLSLLDADGP